MGLGQFAARAAAVLSLTALVHLGGADGAAALTAEEIANYTGADRQQVLEAGAREEGALLWIGGLNERTAARPIVDAFRAEYPFIDAQYIRTGTADALQRVLAEARAGKLQTDLFNGNAVLDLLAADLIEPFKTPALDAYPPEYTDPAGNYVTLRYTYHGVAAGNTTLVTDLPQTYDDLLDPKWKGQMVASDSDTTGLPFLITYFLETRGEAATNDYFEKLATQDVKISSASIRNLTDLVIAGEYQLLINPALHHIAQSRALGAPIDTVFQEPVLTRNDYVSLLKGAPHPHAAMLMIDFMLSEEAQAILREASYYPAHPKIDPLPEMVDYRPAAKGYRQAVIDDAVIQKHAEKANEIFTRLFH